MRRHFAAAAVVASVSALEHGMGIIKCSVVKRSLWSEHYYHAYMYLHAYQPVCHRAMHAWARAASIVFPGSELRADLAAFLATRSKIESKNIGR